MTRHPAARSPSPPVYLERRSYRARRLVDACKLVPALGVLLWLIPLLWPQDGTASVPTSQAMIYIFGVWLALIVIGATLAKWLRPDPHEGPHDPAEPGA
ncbi:hypothetical protein [Pseudaestuariivita sp.]|uniref:hypothetical protein n=1 Tax=Pseudaestuariivita sp. TaxID=2211669 RepID=UPI004057F784